MSNRDRRHHDTGDFEGDGDHWISAAKACRILLERLIEHHQKQTDPTAKLGPFNGSGPSTTSTNQRHPARDNADD